MALRFSEYQTSSPGKRLRPPPNYFSRRVQLRVMMLVAALLFVVLTMLEVRKPEFWQWMGFPAPAPDADSTGDGRTAPQGSGDADGGESGASGENASAGGVIPSRPDSLANVDLANPLRELAGPSGSDATPLERAWRDGWRQVTSQLPRNDRDMLCRALLAARRRVALAENDGSAWSGTLFALDGLWHRYLADASHSVVLDNANLSEEEKSRWLALLEQLEARWSNESRPALEEAVAGRTLDAAQQRHLAWVQSILDEQAMGRVKDNALFRADDGQAWFRLLEILRTARPEQLVSASLGNVSDRELTDRPQEYRGRLVTIRGVAHLGYRMPAPNNLLGVSEYSILWIKPQRRDGVPLTVYVLETPDGFPPLEWEGHEGSRTALDEPIELTGYFFKVRAYASNEGVSTAPVVLARSFRSTRPPGATTTPSEVSWSEVAWSVAAALLLAGLVATWVFRYGGRSGKDRSAEEEDDQAIASLGKVIESAEAARADSNKSTAE